MNSNYIKENANDVVHHLEYNAERTHLIIPEYGRHLQKLIDQATAIENADERNKAAKYIIQVMGSLNPHIIIIHGTRTKHVTSSYTKYLNNYFHEHLLIQLINNKR